MKKVLNERVKELILSKIFIAEYREVMRLVLEDYSKDKIAYKTGYSVRQIERIRGRCWQEVCIYLAEDIIKINDGELIGKNKCILNCEECNKKILEVKYEAQKEFVDMLCDGKVSNNSTVIEAEALLKEMWEGVML